MALLCTTECAYLLTYKNSTKSIFENDYAAAARDNEHLN